MYWWFSILVDLGWNDNINRIIFHQISEIQREIFLFSKIILATSNLLWKLGKKLWLTILLAAVLWGIGHIYLGVVKRGITILIVGIVSSIVVNLFVPIPYSWVILIGYWLWQIWDAYQYYKKLNVGQTQVSQWIVILIFLLVWMDIIIMCEEITYSKSIPVQSWTQYLLFWYLPSFSLFLFQVFIVYLHYNIRTILVTNFKFNFSILRRGKFWKIKVLMRIL